MLRLPRIVFSNSWHCQILCPLRVSEKHTSRKISLHYQGLQPPAGTRQGCYLRRAHIRADAERKFVYTLLIGPWWDAVLQDVQAATEVPCMTTHSCMTS